MLFVSHNRKKTLRLAKVLKLRRMDHFKNTTDVDASFSDNHSYGLSLFLHTTDMDL
jgi:hypothetical protein